ncbi:MAG: adenylate/guanylate cyclase domain-containing protein, partial [Bacteroidetes bacterium]|nr:adenylate/guanylate cyclase domain-containing protein [Bacteroidota bacterium]
MSTRRLAAIMFTDIVGYTAMMQKNEAEGMAKAHAFRKVMQTRVEAHHGELLEIRGDGSLSVFNSAVDAVACAKEIQETLREDVP